MKPEPDEITKAIGSAVDSIPVWGNPARLSTSEADICFLDGYWSLAALTEAIRAELAKAGYAIVLDEAQLLEKGKEIALK